MGDIHFIHTTDWHLGFFQHNKTKRFRDFYNAAKQVVEKILRIKPDFVLHTGDLFHHSKPSPGAIRQVVRLLKRIGKQGIPIYIIRGNHDGRDTPLLRRGGGIIPLLKDLDLVHYIDDRVVELDNLNAKILGVGYYPGKGVIEKIDELLSQESNFLDESHFRILGIHAFVEGQLEEYSQIPLSKLSELGVDYIGAGHYHIPWKREKQRIFAPGSTEATSSNDWRRPDAEDGITGVSTIFEIHANSKSKEIEINTHNLHIRPKLLIEEELEGNKDKVLAKLRKIINQKIDKIKDLYPRSAQMDPMIKLQISSRLTFEQISDITNELENEFSEVLHFHIDIEGIGTKTYDRTESILRQDVDSIILEEANVKEGSNSTFLEIANGIIDELGVIPPSRSLEDDIFEDLVETMNNEALSFLEDRQIESNQEEE